MPLPELRQTPDWCAIDFREVTTVRNVVLAPRHRITALSRQGILLLQQRYTFHLTWLTVPLANLNEVSLPVFTETELLTDWVDAALQAAPDMDEATAAEAAAAFHAYLDEDDRRRRKRLQQPHLHADIRASAVTRLLPGTPNRQRDVERTALPGVDPLPCR